MRDPLIGAVLNSLLSSYNEGACDNMTAEQQDELLRRVSELKDEMSDKQDKVYTIEETSRYLRVSRQTVSDYVRQGKLTPVKHLGGVLEFKFKDLKKFVEENKKS